jgi:hypothetical protein
MEEDNVTDFTEYVLVVVVLGADPEDWEDWEDWEVEDGGDINVYPRVVVCDVRGFKEEMVSAVVVVAEAVVGDFNLVAMVGGG